MGCAHKVVGPTFRQKLKQAGLVGVWCPTCAQDSPIEGQPRQILKLGLHHVRLRREVCAVLPIEPYQMLQDSAAAGGRYLQAMLVNTFNVTEQKELERQLASAREQLLRCANKKEMTLQKCASWHASLVTPDQVNTPSGMALTWSKLGNRLTASTLILKK